MLTNSTKTTGSITSVGKSCRLVLRPFDVDTLEHPLTVLRYIGMPLGRPAAGLLRDSYDLRTCQVLRQADIAHESHLGDFDASDVPRCLAYTLPVAEAISLVLRVQTDSG